MGARVLDIEALTLKSGGHKGPKDGFCVMEAVAYFAGEAFSDHPECASPVPGTFLRNWNDSVDDAFRQKLKKYIPLVVGTAGDGKDEARAWMCTDWLVRVCAPAWLDLAKLTQHATALRTADVITDIASAKRVRSSLDNVRRDSAAARAAARDAAWDAAWAAAAAAAGAVLRPTVEILQESALELLDRMVA